MSRVITFLALATLLIWSAAARAQSCGAFIDPNAFGQQAHATLRDGQLVIERTTAHMICETYYTTEKRTKTIEMDGQTRNVEYEVQVPVTKCKTVQEMHQHKVAASQVQVFDMQVRPVSAEKLEQLLAKGSKVLFATRKVPKYYLAVYKSETLLLVVPPQSLYGTPALVPSPAPPPAPPEAPNAPPSETAAPLPVSRLAVAFAPSAPASPPPPTPVPAQAGVASQPAIEPQVSLAQLVDRKLSLRSYVKETSSQTAMSEVDVDGVKKLKPIQIDTESIIDVERRYPRDAVRIYRADKKPLTESEVAKLLSTGRCVLVAADGQDVASSYLEIVKPDALIVVTPNSAPYEAGMTAPSLAPPPLAPPAPRAVVPSAPAVPVPPAAPSVPIPPPAAKPAR